MRSRWKKSLLLIFSGITISSIRGYVYVHVFMHTKLYKAKGAWNVSANNSGLCGPQRPETDLRQIAYILVFYNISFSWLLPLGRFPIYFFVAWQWKRSISNLFSIMWASSEGQSQDCPQGISFQQVSEKKQEVSDQLHLRKVPSVYRTCCKIFFKPFGDFVQRNVDNCILDLISRLILRQFRWRKFMKLKLKAKWREKSLIQDSTFTW